MKTSELIGPALEWAVAKCEAFDTRNNYIVWVTIDNGVIEFYCCADDWEHAYEQASLAYPNGKVAATDEIPEYSPSANWSQGGPIIERERISTLYMPEQLKWWATNKDPGEEESMGYAGPTPLIAAMRCYVTSKLGEEVEIPEAIR